MSLWKRVLVASLPLLMMTSTADAHGYLTEPPSRNKIARAEGKNYCPHCLNGGTVATVQANSPGGQWFYPETASTSVRHGLCGDPVDEDQKHMLGGEYVGNNPAAARVYQENEIIEVSFSITTHHRGHVEFFICDAEGGKVTQDCLNQHPLRRVEDPDSSIYVPIDPAYPGRYFLPPKCAGNSGIPDEFYPSAYAYKTKLQLPPGLKCERCVLQWYYLTANTCNPPGYKAFQGWPSEFSDCDGDGWGTGWYGREVADCLGSDSYPEEFWNCADIKIVASDIPMAPTNPPVSTLPEGPEPEPVTTSPTPVPTSPAPTTGATGGNCVARWGTCGGENYNGPACCAHDGDACQKQGRWYSQCRPDCPAGWECAGNGNQQPIATSSPSPFPTPAPTASPTAGSSGGTAGGQCVAKWGTCGGDSYNGPTCCQAGLQCFREHRWYSQCRSSCPSGWDCESSPNPSTSTPQPTPGSFVDPTSAPTRSGSGNNANFVAEHGKLTLNGVQLVDENNDTVQLMGMSSHGLHWFPDCYTKESIEYLVDNWNINVFRAAMYVDEGGYLSQKEALKERVSDIVDWCEEIGIYVLIDWHILTPGNPQVSQDESILFWQEMAAKYVDKKHVLYEIANEPNGCDWGSNIKPYHDAVIRSIREIDADTIIIAGTPNWSQFLWDAEANPVAQPHNVMYSFHFYSGTHTNWDQIATYLTKIPVFVTEWGTSEASGDNGPYLDNARTWLDTFAGTRVDTGGVVVSWLNWSYADKSETSGALRPGACPAKNWGDVSESGAFVRDYILDNSFW